MIRKADIILAVILIVLGLAASYALSAGEESGQMVRITVAGEEYATYSLAEDRTVTVDKDNHTNKITIKDGAVSMTFSDCKGQDCVHQGKITKTSQSIVCLPNKIVIEIEGENQEYDAISR
ncbi:NusG domain II-containing protein [Anaerovorax odorimutans]|uniref:NusG domain II-containing protein n=1 Tax=Anaerovorax odorimutans TaxID=109327 RepID=A0ABT1RNL8_9FIRM|nr:NusG domain II-containing protein [Anaerovorax odorimutans]MCQ4636783.1 NusG domain II-containing protein [Anaerovorax odorimutans]